MKVAKEIGKIIQGLSEPSHAEGSFWHLKRRLRLLVILLSNHRFNAYLKEHTGYIHNTDYLHSHKDYTLLKCQLAKSPNSV